jgi:isopentenyl diphosphate isomerase/L-lactate dehydrogenase-like FMN-dependent dehydrogenase
MKSEEIIRKGKDILAKNNIVEWPIQNGKEIIEPTVPGLGGMGSGITLTRNRTALSKYFIKTTLIGESFTPKTSAKIFGQEISFPIMSAPMSGIKSNLRGTVDEEKFMRDILTGCKMAGTIGIGGDSFDTTNDFFIPKLVSEIGGIGVCKPRNFDLLSKRINELKKAKPYAIGIDIDGIARMLINTNEVTRKNKSELRKIRALFKGPMFLKGIMSVEDALAAYETGFDGIVISNHGGRATDYGLGTADILPIIAKKLKGKIKILVDGGIYTGYDVFVYLALGADAVLVGRTILYAAVACKYKDAAFVICDFYTERKTDCHWHAVSKRSS